MQPDKAALASMLEDGLVMCSDIAHSRLQYLSECIFDFTTYDSEMSELFGLKAVEVCRAINDRTTFDYIEDPENYRWFLLMCNMPFFVNRLSWGTSIRGAWWCMLHAGTFRSTGLYIGHTSFYQDIKFDDDGWKEFISAIIEFADKDSA